MSKVVGQSITDSTQPYPAVEITSHFLSEVVLHEVEEHHVNLRYCSWQKQQFMTA